jgi:hypothetical protein
MSKKGLTNASLCDMIALSTINLRKQKVEIKLMSLASLVVVLLISLLLIVKEPLPVGRT